MIYILSINDPLPSGEQILRAHGIVRLTADNRCLIMKNQEAKLVGQTVDWADLAEAFSDPLQDPTRYP